MKSWTKVEKTHRGGNKPAKHISVTTSSARTTLHIPHGMVTADHVDWFNGFDEVALKFSKGGAFKVTHLNRGQRPVVTIPPSVIRIAKQPVFHPPYTIEGGMIVFKLADLAGPEQSLAAE
jgi:hypothetical protein